MALHNLYNFAKLTVESPVVKLDIEIPAQSLITVFSTAPCVTQRH